jgi:hypothetical protein
VSKATKTKGLEEAVQVDTAASPIIYIGKAPIGTLTSAPLWQISKLDTTGGAKITWTGGGNYTQIWDNRTSLTYA